ncbi:MAG: gliding motility-associated C-terminal domain-containing protein [Bacteroidetes bacterium]|nr:gliding motility-associated C-terminal domain-containing protein [Bacteroidota bacterium]
MIWYAVFMAYDGKVLRRCSMLFISMVLPFLSVTAQPPCAHNVSAGNDIYSCPYYEVTITANLNGGNFNIWSWESHPDIFDPSQLSQTINPYETSTYTFNAYGVINELIVNGDFSQGNTGFSSQYIYSPGDLWSEATYDVLQNPSTSHSYFATCDDHTPGTGNMMCINGSGTANTSIWCETVSVTSNTTYAFSCWLCSVYAGSPAMLQFSVNGVLLGQIFEAEYSTCIWKQFYELWNSGANTTATICIVNMNTATGGNDFAIDDISFAEICISSDEVTVFMGNTGNFGLDDNMEMCEGQSVDLNAGTGGIDYQWSTGQSGEDDSIITVISPGTYSVTMTDDCYLQHTDQVVVSVIYPPDVNLGEDVSICEGETAVFDAGYGFLSYQWSTGATTQSINASQQGNYAVTITNQCGSATDQVEITEVHQVPDIDFGQDRQICAGESLLLAPGAGYLSYLWQDGATGESYTATDEGMYWVSVTNEHCSAIDTMMIEVIQTPWVSVDNDVELCEGQSVTFNAQSNCQTYQWSTGEFSQSITVSAQGTYSVTVSNICGDTSASVSVTSVYEYPDIELGPDAEICEGENIVLNPGASYDSYLWQNGTTGESLTAVFAGTYSVTVTNAICSTNDQMTLTVVSVPEVDIGEDTYFCTESILLDAGSENSTYSIVWQDGTNARTYTATEVGSYSVTVTNNCGYDSDTILLQDCPDCIVDIPSAFSPNGDGLNDVLYIRGSGYTSVELMIFNRYGETVFVTNDPSSGWNGFFGGKIQESEVFVYYLTAECMDGESVKKKGTVTIVK